MSEEQAATTTEEGAVGNIEAAPTNEAEQKVDAGAGTKAEPVTEKAEVKPEIVKKEKSFAALAKAEYEFKKKQMAFARQQEEIAQRLNYIESENKRIQEFQARLQEAQSSPQKWLEYGNFNQQHYLEELQNGQLNPERQKLSSVEQKLQQLERRLQEEEAAKQAQLREHQDYQTKQARQNYLAYLNGIVNNDINTFEYVAEYGEAGVQEAFNQILDEARLTGNVTPDTERQILQSINENAKAELATLVKKPALKKLIKEVYGIDVDAGRSTKETRKTTLTNNMASDGAVNGRDLSNEERLDRAAKIFMGLRQ